MGSCLLPRIQLPKAENGGGGITVPPYVESFYVLAVLIFNYIDITPNWEFSTPNWELFKIIYYLYLIIDSADNIY